MTPAGPGEANVLTVALAVAAGALLSIERKAWAQLMLARPLVVGPVVGALLGDAATGLAIGIPLELYFLANASYGASAPEHETWTTLFATGIATGAVSAGAPTSVALSFAAFLALPIASPGRRLEKALERSNERLLDEAMAALATGDTGRASSRALPSLASIGLVGAGITLAGIALGPVVGRLALWLPLALQTGLTFSWAVFNGLCVAQALRAVRTSGGPALSGLAALVVFAAAALWWWTGG